MPSKHKHKEYIISGEGEPKEIHGILNIESNVYALVQWGSAGKVYLPYDFIRDKYPGLLIKHYMEKSRFRRHGPKTDSQSK